MGKTHRYLLALSIILPVIVMADDEVNIYEPGLDIGVTSVIADLAISDMPLLIVKRYLSARKSKYDPGRSKYIEYILSVLGKHKEIALMTVSSDDVIHFGKESYIDGHVYIPVMRNYKNIEIFSFDVQTSEVKRVVASDLSKLYGNIHITSAIAIQDGYIVAYGTRTEEAAISYFDYAGINSYRIPINLNGGSVNKIFDFSRQGRKISFIGRSSKKSESSLWVGEIRQSKENTYYISSDKSFIMPQLSKAWFISEGEDERYFVTVERDDISMRPNVSVYAYTEADLHELGQDKLLWRKKYNDAQGDSRAKFAIQCGQLIYAEKEVEEKPFGSAIKVFEKDVNSIEAPEKMLDRLWMDRDIAADFYLFPYEDRLMFVLNYSRLEDKRRDDGWYGWEGYKVMTVAHADCKQ